MITLQQDNAGFIRMNKHFPQSTVVAVAFADGTVEQFSGRQLNDLFDAAEASFRLGNRLDAKGFSRRAPKTVQSGNTIEFVPIQPTVATA
ncbi:hypothetical protein [Glaciibacter psychrotolerans]|uniref:Uncharacterized protein n=1 Tax=Glaciibacter psychrotolerans TaxID=670054 RepID=A0A7Z0J672_9MICO|nr:hypothetical protein [Leifsonia psychrotolerans]NYJ20090.1 hypothetical protein [Leifsonia psychrotolerans]